MDILILLSLYFLPTIVALLREHNNGVPIFVLNLFLGWTIVVWIICLAWSGSYQEEK